MSAYLSLIKRGRGWGGRLFEAGRLLTFSTFRMGAYSRWALIRGWALIRINTVTTLSYPLFSLFLPHFFSFAGHLVGFILVEKFSGKVLGS